MKKALIGSTALAGVLVLAVSMSPVFATCPGGLIEPLAHSLGGYFSNCPEPVKAYAYALSTGSPGDTSCPTMTSCNTAAMAIACTDGTALNSQGGPCQPEAGTPNDGNVTISFDWGGGGTFPGCPNPAQQAGVGRNYVQLVAANGASLFVSVSWSFDLGAYAVDMAQPDSFPAAPISCTFTDAGLQFTSYNGTDLCGTMPVARPHTDCDFGTWGATGGGFFPPSCHQSSLFNITRGRLYRIDVPCGTAPDPTVSSGWVLVPINTADPRNANFATNGTFCVPMTKAAAGMCSFIGATATIGSFGETLAMVGNLQVGGVAAPSARALDVRASKAGKDIVVSFRTAGELGLIGFNLLTDGPGGKGRVKVNDALIAPTGVQGGGSSYTVRVSNGNFKGGKNVYVESVLTSGTLLSDPANF